MWTEPFPPFSRYVLRHDDFTGLGPRESGLRRRRTDKVERNKCDKPKRDSVVAASRRYLKVNVLWRTAANCSNYNTRFSDYSQRRRPLLPSPLDPREETSMPKTRRECPPFYFSRPCSSPFPFLFLLFLSFSFSYKTRERSGNKLMEGERERERIFFFSFIVHEFVPNKQLSW